MSTEVPPVVALLARVFTFVCVLASIVMVANYIPHVDEGKVKFNGFSAHKFTSPLGIIGILFAYMLFQTSFVFIFTGDGKGGVMFYRFLIYASGVGLDIGSKAAQGSLELSKKLIGNLSFDDRLHFIEH